MSDEIDYGILTICYDKDYIKAIGLALSLELTNYGVKRAVIAPQHLLSQLAPFFDILIPERTDLKGFEHKIYLDEYTPFENTFFLDADMLAFKNFQAIFKKWKNEKFIAQGCYSDSTFISTFGLDSNFVLNTLGKELLVNTSGAGHSFFKKSEASLYFDEARLVKENYSYYGDNLRFADEDAMNIALTKLGGKVHEGERFMGMPCHALNSKIDISVVQSICSYNDELYGVVSPCVMHFAARQATLLYIMQLISIFSYYKISSKYFFKLYFNGINWIYDHTKWALMQKLKSHFGM